LDKAPDAFRTISEVADDLDIPQHVLRFWETRFTQIKPMKRSGGRRYYRPDDIDLLRGIRRLLYGEGYTIRGVQRILKEHGVASVQRLADATAIASFGAIEEVVGRSIVERDHDDAPGIDVDDDDYEAPTASIFVCSKPMRTESRRPWMPARSPASPRMRARLTSHAWRACCRS
jgi:Predicted transcriptional regulators